MSRRAIAVVAVAIVLSVTGCATLRRLGIGMERPEVTLERVSLESVTFTQADLVADIRVHNPNPVGIRMAGFAYALEIEGTPFVAGDNAKGVSIDSFGDSDVRLPVSIGFPEMVETIRVASARTEVAYRLTVAFRFEVPILGVVSIPLEREGTLPVLRLPRVRVADLKLQQLRIAGADLTLTLEVENPNGFSATVQDLEYAFLVQEQTWVEGRTAKAVSVAAGGQARVAIPFSLSFTAFGRTVRDLLVDGGELRFGFAGRAVIDPDVAIMGPTEIPLAFEGSIPLSR